MDAVRSTRDAPCPPGGSPRRVSRRRDNTHLHARSAVAARQPTATSHTVRCAPAVHLSAVRRRHSRGTGAETRNSGARLSVPRRPRSASREAARGRRQGSPQPFGARRNTTTSEHEPDVIHQAYGAYEPPQPALPPSRPPFLTIADRALVAPSASPCG